MWFGWTWTLSWLGESVGRLWNCLSIFVYSLTFNNQWICLSIDNCCFFFFKILQPELCRKFYISYLEELDIFLWNENNISYVETETFIVYFSLICKAEFFLTCINETESFIVYFSLYRRSELFFAIFDYFLRRNASSISFIFRAECFIAIYLYFLRRNFSSPFVYIFCKGMLHRQFLFIRGAEFFIAIFYIFCDGIFHRHLSLFSATECFIVYFFSFLGRNFHRHF